MHGDIFGQVRNQRPGDLTYLDDSGQWQVLHIPSAASLLTNAGTVGAKPAWTAKTASGITLPSTSITDFTEAAQDAVLAVMGTSSKISFSYFDSTNSLQATIVGESLGPDDIANRTRSFFLDATRFMAGTGTPDLAIRGSSDNAYDKVPAWAFDPAALESIQTLFDMPTDWNAGAITLSAYWAPSTTDTGNVYWDFVAAGIASATQIDQSLEINLNPSVQAASGTAENLHIKSMGSFTPDSPLIRLAAARQGAEGTDTYTGDAWLLGVLVEYTADS